jgi:hypothetical protein
MNYDMTVIALLRNLLFQFQVKAASSLARLRLLNVPPVRLRRLDPRRLDVIFDLKSALLVNNQGNTAINAVVVLTLPVPQPAPLPIR